MADIVSAKKRSEMMAGIKGKDTKPEIEIRKELHKNGFRYRLHNKLLPGRPDIVLAKYSAVILIHGCFWHGHECNLFKWPSSRKDFWREKIMANRLRDAHTNIQLQEKGWRVLEVWECSVKGTTKLARPRLTRQIITWIEGDSPYGVIQGSHRNMQ